MDAPNFTSPQQDKPGAAEAAAGEVPAEYQHLLPAGRVLARQLLTRGPVNGKQAQYLFPHREMALALGKYLLLERLGSVGTGAVCKALHVVMDREVAVRLVPLPGKHSAEQRARLQKDIQLAAHLRHPNLVTVFDVVEIPGMCVLVMEHVPGVDLTGKVAQAGPLPIVEACSLIRQAALGLQPAHEQGLAHGDLQPARLLITGDPTSRSSPDVLLPRAAFPAGIVKILNLGLAWRNEGPVAAVDFSPYDPDYVAPEQAQDVRQADARSDLYSLGCMLYFALTGQPPFPGGTTPEKVYRHQYEEPPDVARLRPDVPRELRTITLRLLAKKPADRYPRAAELAEALALFCTNQFGEREGPRPDSWLQVHTSPELTGSDTNPVVAVPGEQQAGRAPGPGGRQGAWPFSFLVFGAVALGLAAGWVIRLLWDM
jgi:serine/threonine-protein kinase